MLPLLQSTLGVTLLAIVGVIILGILVLVHELGHFIAAKSCGIRVLAFSIGFGRALLKKTIGGTEYRLSAVPFGGFITMAGEHPEEKPLREPGDFTTKPIWQRAVVAIAGPLANYLFAMVCLYFVFILGVKTPVYLMKPVVGDVADSSSAQRAGFLPGDSIVFINGKKVSNWEDIQRVLSLQEQRNEIVFCRGSETKTLFLVLARPKTSRLPKEPTGGLLPGLPPVIGKAIDTMPAAMAGISAGDTVVSINGRTVRSWDQLTSSVVHFDSAKGPLAFTVRRGTSLVSIAVVPRYNKTDKRYQIGVLGAQPAKVQVRYGAAASVGKMLDKTWEYTTMIYDVLAKLLSKQVSPKQLAGPVGIVQMTGIVALGGPVELMNLMGLIGINLAVLNLLPLIITDGGLLLFLLIEAIRRKPLPVRYQLLINRIAITFFILLFAYVTYNDMARLPDLFRLMTGR
ncbi:MAG TPA: RIP metalloprotease RseP [Chitinivibrionales bacterium]|nr:RIP metalloprotease RseP [Chitinivibrionales bacterium]